MLTSLAARIVVGFFFFFAFLVGCVIAGSSLTDPDTCWLLAVGNWIVENRALPFQDPFSYSMGDRPFVAYQWLTELLFFASYKLLGGYGLVGLTDVVIIFSFIIIPLRLFQKWKSSMWAGVTVSVLAVMSAAFHFLTRPEIITYLFLSIWFVLLADLRLRVGAADGGAGDTKSGVNWRLAGSFALLMLFWANMHTGFVLALIVLAIFALVNTIEFVIRRLPLAALSTAWAALILSMVATLANPRGIGLWTYLPDLFFPRLNRFIDELRPFGLNGFTEVQFLPSLILAGLVIAVQVWHLRRSLRGEKVPSGIAFSLILTIAALIGGTIARRMITFSCVFLACELAWLLRGTGVTGPEETQAGDAKHRRWWHSLSAKVGELLASGTWPQVVIVISLFGVFTISTRSVAPEIPQGSGSFVAPFAAIEFLAKNAPVGKCLNDPQYGDLMIWYLQTDVKPFWINDARRIERIETKPKVFIDTRFDMYGSTIVVDYNAIAQMEPGWQERFAKYDFDWAFLPSNWKVANALRAQGWRPIFDDKIAVVLVKP